MRPASASYGQLRYSNNARNFTIRFIHPLVPLSALLKYLFRLLTFGIINKNIRFFATILILINSYPRSNDMLNMNDGSQGTSGTVHGHLPPANSPPLPSNETHKDATKFKKISFEARATGIRRWPVNSGSQCDN
jgi:hypothetical protein